MRALTFDRARESWDSSKGMVLEDIPRPVIDGDPDRSDVVIKVRYAGFCGTDRGIWSRKAMRSMVLDSLDQQTKRVFGHELLGEVVEVGHRVTEKYGYKVGDIVSTESHIVCGTCTQCRLGEHHVCANERIIGVSTDGCFADYVKLPAKALWPTDIGKIRPEIAALQEPFGNAVHACQVTDLRGKNVAILGTGTIGLFAVLIARGMGAGRVIGIEPNAKRAEMARRLGADVVLTPGPPDADESFRSDKDLIRTVRDLTGGEGVDVALEMAGFNNSINNAIQMVRRGGKVVLFGLQDQNAIIEDSHNVIMNGLTLHAVVGRRIFATWEMTKALLEQQDNGIQDAIWKVILDEGRSVISMDDFDVASFEDVLAAHPKPVLKFQ